MNIDASGCIQDWEFNIDDFKTWSFNLGNRAYWLSSAVQYDNGIDVINAGAAVVGLASTLPNYAGNFVYTKGGDFFYIVLDYYL